MTTRTPASDLDVFLLTGEESGDRLGAALMRALRKRTGGQVRFAGAGGREMTAEGIASLYPLDALSIMGITAIPARLPQIWRLMRRTAGAVVAARPQLLVTIDNQEFSRLVARRVRKADPSIAIVQYVAPSVWAWRPGRARAMRGTVDHVLALLPFEPEALAKLGGPPCSYVGHPLTAEVGQLRPNADEAKRRLADPPVLLVLPGSRRGEIERHAEVFGETVATVAQQAGGIEVVVPTVPHLRDLVAQATARWPVRPRIGVTAEEKQAAFRVARAALAKSGTVTLELALAGVPTVAAYRVPWIEAVVARRLIRVPSVILANLVLGENVVPEFLQEQCTAGNLAPALVPLLSDTPERKRQVAAFATLDAIMGIGAAAPAERAADVVLELARKRRAVT